MAPRDPRLQNHPGDVEFPVRRRYRHVRAIDAARRGTNRGIRRALLLAVISVPFGLAGYAWVMLASAGIPVNPLLAFFPGFILGVVAATIVLTVLDAGAPLRAQRDYLHMSCAVPITERQQQILALDASSDFSFRGWNSSLAFTPTFAELPQDVRARFQDGETGSPWVALPLSSVASARSALDEQFKIASGTDAAMLAADTLTGGKLSRQFAEVAQGELREKMMSRVAALTDRPVFDIIELAEGASGAVPRLLLAGDVERAIGGVRYAYVADYIDAEEAWRLLDPLAQRAFETYPDWDAYWDDVLVATAFRTDSLSAVQKQRQNLAALRASSWPAARIAYPHHSW